MTPDDRTILEAQLAQMTDTEVARRYNQCEVESEEADVIAKVMHARQIDN